MNILIIEDDVFLREKIRNIFESKVVTNRVCALSSLQEFYHHISIISSYDIVLTDIKLSPEYNNQDGFEIIQIIRKKDLKIPIVVISGNSYVENLRYAFECWASDYIIKPIRLKELEVRIMNWFKNYYLSHIYFLGNIQSYKDLSYDIESNEFYFQNKKITLTKNSKYILSLFFVHREKLLSENFLIEKIWWDICCIIERNLRVNISRLKKWLSPFGIDTRIQNIHWEWYIFSAQ